MIKTIKHLIGGFIALIFIGFIIIKLAWSQPYKPADIPDTSIDFERINIDQGQIHYAYSGKKDAETGLIFVHGTPGGWAAFERYLINRQLQKEFFMISVDRPGWGASITKNKKLNGVFSHQANSITAIFNKYPDKKWLVVGHSLGASLAPQVALQAPDSVAGLLLLAGSLNPKLGNPRWYNYVASTWLVSKMIGSKMTESNREIMKLRKQLNTMVDDLEKTKLATDVIVIQGMKDRLVSPKNPKYVAEQWQDNFSSVEIIELPKAGHFLPWEHSRTVVNAIHLLALKTSKEHTTGLRVKPN